KHARTHQRPVFMFHLFRAVLGRTLIILLFLFCIASGLIDAWRVIRFDLHTYQMYSKEEMVLATWVKKNTPLDSIWATGDMHNLWLYNLTGRQPLLTFRGWLWTHGYEYQEVERDLGKIYQNPYQSTALLKKYGVDY